MISQHPRPGMVDVPGRREQDHLALTGEIPKMAHGDGGGGTMELGEIAAGELFKPGGLVAIPPAQFSAWSDVLQPLIEPRLALFHSAGPESIDQDPFSWRDRLFIDAMDREGHGCRIPQASSLNAGREAVARLTGYVGESHH